MIRPDPQEDERVSQSLKGEKVYNRITGSYEQPDVWRRIRKSEDDD